MVGLADERMGCRKLQIMGPLCAVSDQASGRAGVSEGPGGNGADRGKGNPLFHPVPAKCNGTEEVGNEFKID